MNADPHHTRSHSVWAASATSRNVVCAGAIAMATLCEERESEAAAWGSACHQVSERCLVVGNLETSSFLGTVEKSGKLEFTVDEDMCSCAQEYVDYVSEKRKGKSLFVETPLSLRSIGPALEAGGTGDAIIYDADQKHLEIVDLKSGRGVIVEVAGNPQMRTYAIGALLALPNLVVEKVTTTIVQPRAAHRDGRIRSETFHVTELLDWVVDLLPMIQRAKDALDEFNALGSNRLLFDAWADKWLKTGQCQFCAAQAICPKRRQEALAAMPKIAREWHEDVTMETPLDLTNLAKIGSPEELAHDLDGFEAIEDWIKSRRAYAHGLAEKGTTIPGYQLADKIGNRAFIEKDENKLAMALYEHLKMPRDQVFEKPSIKSVAQIEKTLGSRKAELAKLEKVLWEKPIKGSNLVTVSKTTRPAAKTVAERFHEQT
jgi:Protein of unknown function (DUF2800)